MTSPPSALETVRQRARADRAAAQRRWAAATGSPIDQASERLARAGRLTINFHPDRRDRSGRSVVAGLLADGEYRTQWVTGTSSGSRSATRGGERERWEATLFGAGHRPVYGAFDLLLDPHGGSPRFGSAFLVLGAHVAHRTTFMVGDSHAGPQDVGTIDEPWSVLAGLAEQAAAGRLLGRPLDTDVLLAALDGAHRSSWPSRELDGYVEIQVHGGVSLGDDVEQVVADPSFRGTEVADALTAAAQRYGFALRWHPGSELAVGDVPADFRGPAMPAVAAAAARPDGIVDARSIGRRAERIAFTEPRPAGDPPESELQQLKYLWHTLLRWGHAAA